MRMFVHSLDDGVYVMKLLMKTFIYDSCFKHCNFFYVCVFRKTKVTETVYLSEVRLLVHNLNDVFLYKL